MTKKPRTKSKKRVIQKVLLSDVSKKHIQKTSRDARNKYQNRELLDMSKTELIEFVQALLAERNINKRK